MKLLAEYVTDHKKSRIDQVLDQRTYHFTVVLEDIYKEHNASAVVRTCECLGIQNLHIIEDRYDYHVNPDVVQGSSKWINIIQYNEPKTHNTARCYDALRKDGYQILATSTSHHDTHIDEIDITQKSALVFGTELEGLSEYAIKQADGCVKIPIYGFTESYNLSVCAAISMSDLIARLHGSEVNWKLSLKEQQLLKLEWYRKIVKKSAELEKTLSL